MPRGCSSWKPAFADTCDVKAAIRGACAAVLLWTALPVPPANAAGPTCFGVRATVVGTRRPDQLAGTSGRDVIAGLGGDDVLYGMGGNDLVCGGPGDDSIYGDDGRDRISGGRGNDVVIGGGGADVIRGNGGNDVLYGDGVIGPGLTGRDTIYGGRGDDHLTGGPRTDIGHGGPGLDTCISIEVASGCESYGPHARGSASTSVRAAVVMGSSAGRGSETRAGRCSTNAHTSRATG